MRGTAATRCAVRTLTRALVVGCAAAMAGCAQNLAFVGVDAASGVEIALRPIPGGHDFSGTYRSPHIGELTLEQRGSTLTGRYRYEADGRRVVGALGGNVRANLATIRWHEQDLDASRSDGVSGIGFFLYDRPEDGACPPDAPRPARLFGRRRVATRIFPSSPDEAYAWLNVGQRDEPWTAVEVLRGGPRL